MKKTKLFTVVTHDNGYFKALQKSAKKFNYDFLVLGLNKKWKGLIWKFKLMLKNIDSLPNNEIIVFCDGFDVIVNKDSEEMIDFFKKQNKDIFFGWEASNYNLLMYCLSLIAFKNQHLLKREDIPNTGVYIGYVWAIRIFLRYCLDNITYENDDQDIAYKAFANQKKLGLNLGITNRIFTIPLNLSEFFFVFKKFDDNHVDYKFLPKNNNYLFIHANGNRNMDKYVVSKKLPKGKVSYSNHKHLTHFLGKVTNNLIRSKIFWIIVLLIIIKNIPDKKN